MLIIPAVDIRDGRVVRLLRGDFDQETVYSNAPEETVLKWQAEGAELVHVVDLDGAVAGRRKNLGSLKNICAVSKVPIQFGGGLRSVTAVVDVVKQGVSRVVIGSKLTDLKLIKELVKKFGDKIVAGIDVKNGALQIGGWKSQVKLVKVESLVQELELIGVRSVIYTDVTRDGTLIGPNVDDLKYLLQKTSMQIIASGGISSLDDIRRLKQLNHPRLMGVIVGKALYEKRFTLREAVRITNGRS